MILVFVLIRNQAKFLQLHKYSTFPNIISYILLTNHKWSVTIFNYGESQLELENSNKPRILPFSD